ncbi:MAG: glycosyltransferase family 4 protein [Pseudomonadota bacterium]
MGVWPPTVLQVTPRLNSGGVERGALEIAEAITAAGGRALIASEGGRLEPRLAEVGAELVRLPVASKNPLEIQRNVGRLAEAIRAQGVDLIHARSRAPAWSALGAARRTATPFVTTYHGVYNEGAPGKRFYNSVMARGDRVIAISEMIADLIWARHGVGMDRVRVIHRGADTRLFSADAVAPERVATLRAAWGLIEETRPIVLLPGRLTRWKGQTVFLEALAILRRRGGPAALALLVGGDEGDGAFHNELAAQIERLELGAEARLVGACEDMPAAYRLGDLAVSASTDPEAFGRVAVEAQAMGLPVIATAHGGALETVAAGETGWLVAPRSPEALAEALAEALGMAAEGRWAMSEAAVARARERFSVAAMQSSTLAVYRELLEG